jgi:quercetin dioxygenase-like cupin family protein
MLLKLKKLGGRLHIHTSDYHLTLLQGTMKHWAEGEQEADAKPLGPGSYWFQPGNQAHGDSCLTDECLMFVKWEGKRDAKLAEAPKK